MTASAIALLYSAPAFAQDYGITSSNSDPVFVAETDNVVGAKSGVYSTGTELNLTNEGTIRGNGTNAFTSNTDAGIAFNGGPANITNSGDISGARFGISSFYYFTDLSDPENPIYDGRAIGSTLVNSGSIIGDSDDGVRFIGGGTVTNSGYIAGRVGAGADGISMFSFEGQDLDSFDIIGTVTNLAGGVIEGNRFGIIMSNGGNVDNAGTISGNEGSILLQAQTFDTGRVGTVSNTGTLYGMVSFFGLASATVSNDGAISSTSGPAIHSYDPLTVTNGETGTIEGSTSGILNHGPALVVTNAGTIYGGGTYDGYEASPDGAIAFSGGPATITNSGLILGEGFGITSYHYYNPETGLLEARAIGSSITNSGDIIGLDDDGIRLIGGGTVTNSGLVSGGVDGTFVNADGISIFSLTGQDVSAITSIGTVTNLAGGIIEGRRFGITMGNGGTVDNAGTITGGTGGILIQDYLGSGDKIGTITNSGTINGGVNFFGLASATVTNSGTITGATSGIRDNSETLTVDNSGTIRGNGLNAFTSNTDAGIAFNGGPANITNSGDISGARFGISSFYYFTDFSDPENPIYDGRAIGSTLVNSGSIIGDSDDGVRFIGGGTVTNSGYIAGRVGSGADGISMFSFEGQDLDSFDIIGTVTNLAGGVIEGNRFGIIMSNGGAVDNAGTISGNAGAIAIQTVSGPDRTGSVVNSGTINGQISFNGLASATVTNSGTITGAASGIRDNSETLTVDNSGTIRGNGLNAFTSNTDAGIAFNGGPANITNSGDISGARFGITSFYYYTNFSDPENPIYDGRAIGSTLVNSGSIIGDSDDGVRFIGGGTVTNSGYISGRVDSGADGISMFSYVDQPLDGFDIIGTVTNLAGGVIEGNRFGIIMSNGGAVDNAGTISGNAGGILIQAQSFDPGRVGTVTNSGMINGQVSFFGLASATVNNDGTMSSTSGPAIHSYSPLTVTNGETGTIQGSTSGIFDEGPSLTINNAGTIYGAGTYDGFAAPPDAGITFSGGPATITNSGLILGEGFGITTAHYYNPETGLLEARAIGSTVTNSGQIVGVNNDGVRLIGGGTVTNSGLISGGVGGSFAFADGVSIFSLTGQDVSAITSIGTVTNLAGGLIEGWRFGITMGNGGTVDNAGTITGGTGGILIQDYLGSGDKIGTVTNSGTINGGVSFFGLASASINNSGTITKADGFAVRGTPGTPLSITNTATGLIEGSTSGIFDEGPALTVSNAGTIYGAGTYDGFDAAPDAGITYSGGPATITNSGLILGEGFGITTAHYYNASTGLLEARAIGSTVTNSGQIVGVNNDGVRLIGGGTVTNSGLISGGVGGSFINADGISMFSLNGQDLTGLTSIGTVTNLATGNIEGERFGIILSNGGTVTNAGTISGGTGGVHIQDGANSGNKIGTITNTGAINGGVSFNALASATLTNSGSIVSSAGPAVSVTGGPLSWVNSGTVSGTGGLAAQLSAGNDAIELRTGSLITGIVDGGDGDDSLTLVGKATKTNGGEILGSFANVEHLTVSSGYWTASGATGNFANIQIGGGVLQVDGSIGGNVGIASLARLTGNGTVNGSISVAGGGTLAPGSGIGTLTVNGDVSFSSGALFQVDASTRSADLLQVSGSVSIGNNVPVQVLARNGNYAPTSTYTILNSAGGITGQFSAVTTDLAFLTPNLVQGSNSVALTLVRNSKKFTTASTTSTFQVASAVEGLGATSPLYAALLSQSELGAAAAFRSLGTSASATADNLLLNLDEGITWSDGQPRTAGGMFTYRSSFRPAASGAAFGRQVGFGPVSAMMVVGERFDRAFDDSSTAAIQTRFVETALGARFGSFQLGLAARRASSEMNMSRNIEFPGFAESVIANGSAESRKLTVGGQYSYSAGTMNLAPHVSYSNERVKYSKINEFGGASALAIDEGTRTIHRAAAGLRLSTNWSPKNMVISPWVDLTAQSAWGDLYNNRMARFTTGSEAFVVGGTALNSRSLHLDAGIEALVGAIAWRLNYRAVRGNVESDHSISTALTVRF